MVLGAASVSAKGSASNSNVWVSRPCVRTRSTLESPQAASTGMSFFSNITTGLGLGGLFPRKTGKSTSRSMSGGVSASAGAEIKTQIVRASHFMSRLFVAISQAATAPRPVRCLLPEQRTR